MFNENMQLAT